VGAVDFRIVKGPRFSVAELDRLLALIRSRLGGDMQIDVHFVDHIALVRTGKYRHSVSKLQVTPELFARYQLGESAAEAEGVAAPSPTGRDN
jgi:hypothetical protein